MATNTEVGSIYLRLSLDNNIQSQVQQATEQTAQTAAASFGSMFKKAFSIAAITAIVGKIKSVAEEYQAAYEAAIEPELKLATVMKQRMQATQEEIDSVIEYAGALEKQGVVGADVAAAGAQQLATFLNSSEAVKTLIPAMNNLVAQQKGYNATQGDAVSIGNLFGKVMQGQTTALTKVGITFSEAEEQALKYADEEERAAILAEIITNNVGEMNAALAATDTGKQVILSARLGEIQESLGESYLTLKTLFTPALEAALDVFASIADRVSYIVNAAKEMAIKYGFIEDNSVSDEMQALQDQKSQIEKQIAALEANTDATVEASENEKNAASFDKFNILSFGEASEHLEEAAESLEATSTSLEDLKQQLTDLEKTIIDLAKKEQEEKDDNKRDLGQDFETGVNNIASAIEEEIPGIGKFSDFVTKFVIYPLAKVLTDGVKAVIENAPKVFSQLWTDAENIITLGLNFVIDTANGVVSSTIDFFEIIGAILSGDMELAEQKVLEFGETLVNSFNTWASNIFNGLKEFWNESWLGQKINEWVGNTKFVEKVEQAGYERSASANDYTYSPYADKSNPIISYQPSVVGSYSSNTDEILNRIQAGKITYNEEKIKEVASGDVNVTIPVYVDGEEIYSTAIKGINRQSQLKGKSQIK
jgi:hypothetical protein